MVLGAFRRWDHGNTTVVQAFEVNCLQTCRAGYDAEVWSRLVWRIADGPLLRRQSAEEGQCLESTCVGCGRNDVMPIFTIDLRTKLVSVRTLMHPLGNSDTRADIWSMALRYFPSQILPHTDWIIRIPWRRNCPTDRGFTEFREAPRGLIRGIPIKKRIQDMLRVSE